MKKSTKNFFLAIGVIFLGFIVGIETISAVYAWDETMSDYELISYLEKYPDSKRLNELAEKRNLK